MTNKDMTELFSVMLLAWPQAEMFKGGIAKLGPTIELWTACTKDIDFWTGQQAVVLLCKTSKFPPTIAEFRQQAEVVEQKTRDCILADWGGLRRCALGLKRFGGIDLAAVRRWYQGLPPGLAKSAVDTMGGPDKLLIGDGKGLDFGGFSRAYKSAMRNKTALPAGQKKLKGV